MLQRGLSTVNRWAGRAVALGAWAMGHPSTPSLRSIVRDTVLAPGWPTQLRGADTGGGERQGAGERGRRGAGGG